MCLSRGKGHLLYQSLQGFTGALWFNYSRFEGVFFFDVTFLQVLYQELRGANNYIIGDLWGNTGLKLSMICSEIFTGLLLVKRGVKGEFQKLLFSWIDTNIVIVKIVDFLEILIHVLLCEKIVFSFLRNPFAGLVGVVFLFFFFFFFFFNYIN